jgi:glycosyltransferase involved in cell wall biosynthesis
VTSQVGVVIIGKNEGERLQKSLASAQGYTVVYADSGSTDGSLSVAEKAGAHVVALDLSRPFTAARGRNEGFRRLRQLMREMTYVQFVDGDTELSPGWIRAASEYLEANPKCAAVAGHLRELHPDQSIYNRLCAIEWQAPVGDTRYCGGIAMFRVSSFMEACGFRDDIAAGEEPELCVRLRNRGWKIHRLATEMGTHDAGMTHFSEWWRRAVRAGHAFAVGASLHGKSPERHWVKEVRSNWAWGALLPSVMILLCWPTSGWSLLGMGLYIALLLRIYLSMRRRAFSRFDSFLYGCACIVAKLAHVVGQSECYLSPRGRTVTMPGQRRPA